MSSLLVLTGAVAALLLGYRFYGTWIEGLWHIDPARPTPAVTKFDGVDYIPSKNWLVLFGHHFASIAGAGPIIGPALAVGLWGWGPTLIWVILGSIFIGGIHDFGALIISTREDGGSIGDIAARSISTKAKIIFSVFIWMALILVIAVFAYFGANTFVTQPEVIVPSFGIIPLAVAVGLALYKFRWNVLGVTLTGLLVLGLLIYIGGEMPLNFTLSQGLWIKILLVYCFVASIVPVNLLLQPRDYLSSFLLFGGIALAIIGIFVSHPTMNAPAYMANKTPIGYLWPMMFITVACGANSGFHSIIASGTTSKQLANERYAKRIGFGSMLLEGLLATLVIILVVGGFSLPEFRQHIADKTSPVNMFGTGFGNVTAPFLGKWGTPVALTILNVFILTTLDSATRITRYITEELFGVKNRYLSTLLVLVCGGALALGKDSANNPLWQKIWPAFGASNQLVAALALLVISCWLLSKNKPTRYALIPALFMLVTSVAALIYQMGQYIASKDYVLLIISAILLCASGYLVQEVFKTFRNNFKKKGL